MKVRTKFTLWISLSSFLAALFFSTFVFVELLEEPDKLINRELMDVGNAILQIQLLKKESNFVRADTDFSLERYWVKLIRENGNVIYSSPLTTSVDIPLKPDLQFYSVKQKVSPSLLWIDPLEDDDVDELHPGKVEFKVLLLSASQSEEKFTVIIAKPLSMFFTEVGELIRESLVGIILTSLLVFLLSYFLAGRILQPLDHINQKVKEIRENSLNDRIPLGKSKDELRTLSISLNSMFDRLHYSFMQQKEFISGAAHEMRSPLTILILGHEEMLGNTLPKKARAELNKQLMTMQRLKKLVKDLLEISLLERQEFVERVEISLPTLIDEVLNDFDEVLKFHRIECTINVGMLKIQADHDKLLRVFINLIDNAIKFNQDSYGQISITTQKKGDFAEIVIENTGEEIPAEDLPHIFKQFYRVEKSRSKKYGGTGLGLTIAKRIVELHGGSISLESEGQRTIARITLPIS